MSYPPIGPSPLGSYSSSIPSSYSTRRLSKPRSPRSHGSRPSTSSLTIRSSDTVYGISNLVAGTLFFPKNDQYPEDHTDGDKGLSRWVRDWRPVKADVVPTQRSLASFKTAPRVIIGEGLNDVHIERLRIRWIELEAMAISFFAQMGECFQIPMAFPFGLLGELPSSVVRKSKGPCVLASLGKLDELPLELVSEVVSYFDVQTAFNFSHISPRARETLVFNWRWKGLFPRLFCVFLHRCGYMRPSNQPFEDFSGVKIPYPLAQQVPLIADAFNAREREFYRQGIESSRPASRALP